MTINEVQYTTLTYVSAESGRTKVRYFIRSSEAYRWITDALWPSEAATAVVN